MCQAFSLWGYGMMIFLVSKLPDKILTPFPCTLYFTHSKKKNPAFGGKTICQRQRKRKLFWQLSYTELTFCLQFSMVNLQWYKVFLGNSRGFFFRGLVATIVDVKSGV